MRPELVWRRALQRSAEAEQAGALIPLSTQVLEQPGVKPFVLRRLVSQTPRHLLQGGPKPNPFLPWEGALEVDRLDTGHVVLLNKYPVQPGHLLLITQDWQPQSGWIRFEDWQAVGQLARDTAGLWFFNSCAAAGASQPHRHLQLLPRRPGEASCPLAALCDAQMEQRQWSWAYQISRRQDPIDCTDLPGLYHHHAEELGLGSPQLDSQPLHPYNLLFDDHWLLTVRRSREHCAGFSINALAFAGYLLATEKSDLTWLENHGPWKLLEAVASSATERI
ncbi:MAG: ATP adenylyltransferase [Synechococcus sp.]|nr:ATP adenylyltransferase [Synechococcus sp.]